jgi:hypothetical protein
LSSLARSRGVKYPSNLGSSLFIGKGNIFNLYRPAVLAAMLDGQWNLAECRLDK